MVCLGEVEAERAPVVGLQTCYVRAKRRGVTSRKKDGWGCAGGSFRGCSFRPGSTHRAVKARGSEREGHSSQKGSLDPVEKASRSDYVSERG